MEKATKKSGSTSVELPVDVIVEILSRLPVKTLLRCKCICRLWNSRISDPSFILSNFGRERALMLCESSPVHGVLSVNFYSVDDEVSVVNLPNPHPIGDLLPSHSYTTLLGACNGLILLLFDQAFYLWNPSTSHCHLMDQLNALTYDERSKFHIFFGLSGLCFDKSSDDYKVVFVSATQPLGDTFSYVASLRKREMCKDISFPYMAPLFKWVIPGF
ncbi:OLC1v1008779C1 [Oldenlandia corymbosa var. corymbosa]|uniref:OLC1v1008779C1 n=1 Tax=Oldenlandia corymbosa var. corymbosa TaxID=529605 RepID=A0AAV1DPV7_OLDCO|nr:OLC1v1008779C1 [Oldenlandia corymbosa var. corymbosa]